ncbi:MAG: FtsX-like permease family protein [Muribaculaceae bacterium]|nr:FtsX-like permease family protein [Muribaculaceae bacterium]
MLALRIATRYLFARKSHAAVNIICGVAILGVAVAVMAIVVVLSVFNGFSSLAERQMGRFDADLRIESARGGRFMAAADSLAAAVAARPEVAAAVAVVDERALATSGSAQMPVRIKGVAAGYEAVTAMDSITLDGAYATDSVYGFAPAQLAVGVAGYLGVRPLAGNVIGLYVPRRLGRINPANPATAFRGDSLAVRSVWQTDRPEFDADRVVVPIDVARGLLQLAPGEASAVEAALVAGTDADVAAARLQSALGDDVRVLTRARQNADSFRMIAVEKWLTFLLLLCILGVAGFNIVSTLSLLVLEKRDNMATLRALGATRRCVRAVFMWQGALVALAGGALGMLLGLCLCLAQQHWGLVRLSADPGSLTISVYPVEVQAPDLLAVAAAVAAGALLSALITRFFTKDL